ncbi:MAG: iron-sulfur cluster biosynthesis family protein [Ectobacillus sp.]
MQIRITDQAREVFKRIGPNQLIVQIEVKPGNSCSAFMDIELSLAEFIESEVVYTDDDVIVLMNTFAKEYIGNSLKIDYKTGFRLDTPNETIAYGMSLQRNQQ